MLAKRWLIPALVAFFGWVAVVVSLDPAGDLPQLPQGPGLTFDETFNVTEGVRLVEGLHGFSLGLVSLKQVFGTRDELGVNAPIKYHLADHPPLGRLWIGLCHKAAKTLRAVGHRNPGDRAVPEAAEVDRAAATPFVTAYARTASATVYALLLLLVGCTAAGWYGRSAGFWASASLLLMPRVFAHAHLAALDLFMALTYTAATLAVARLGDGATPPKWKSAGLAGCVFGLALLSKMQAVLLVPPVVVWAWLRWRRKSWLPLLIGGAAGSLVFFAGWPWLWWDPLEHLQQYFGRSTQRSVVHAWYLGAQYQDRLVPWHYPFVMFLVTVPLGLQFLGCLGLRGWLPPASETAPVAAREWLTLMCMAFPLIVFAIPGVAVYDGCRLFLIVFPLWSVFIGRGGQMLSAWLAQRYSKHKTRLILGCLLLLQAPGMVLLWPCHLSYYNALVAGLSGAERLGFETSYWGDSVSRAFLQRVADAVPPGSQIDVVPVLHQFQLAEMLKQSPILRRHDIRLRPYDSRPSPGSDYILVIQRKADLPLEFRNPTTIAQPVVAVRRMGVQLAALYKWTDLLPLAGGQSTR